MKEDNNKTIDGRLDNIFDFIEDTILVNKDYKLIDLMFENIDFDKWSPSELIGLLTITAYCHDKFPNRHKFWEKLYAELLKIESEKNVEIILKGLE